MLTEDDPPNRNGSVQDTEEPELLFFSGQVYVQREGEFVLKWRSVLDRPELEDAYGHPDLATEEIEDEKRIYRYIGPYHGIVEFCDDDPEKLAVRTLYVSPGDLRKYLEVNKIDQAAQLRWCTTMARTVKYVHDKRVLIKDTRTPNWVVTEDYSVQLIDFGVAEIWEAGTPLDKVNLWRYTIAIELGMLGVVFYEVVTGSNPGYHNWSPGDRTDGRPRLRLPSLERCPRLDGVFLGNIMEKLWTEKNQIGSRITCSFGKC